jgi:UDP-N-acetylmuramate dehydrogenase
MTKDIFLKNVLLKDYTTFKIGGPAKYFFVAKSKEDLIKAIEISKKNKLPIFILGGGSNILFSDKGFCGLVIKLEISGIEFSKNKVVVGSGVKLSNFANIVSKNGFSGFEWAVGIPSATVGGSIFGNAQAFGFKISDTVESVEVLNLKTLKIQKFSKQQCKFSLKNSIFKKNKNFVILSIIFKLKKGDKEEIKNKIHEFLKHRKKCHPIEFFSAGSVFVNPEKKKEMISVGYLIEKIGLKEKKIGNAQISEKHANFIINLGNAKSKDVEALIKLAKQKVKKNFNINLETEIQIVNYK